MLDLPERHPITVAVLLGVSADKWALAQTLEAEEEVGLVLDGGDDNGGKTDMLAGIGVGQKLIAEHGGVRGVHPKLLQGKE